MSLLLNPANIFAQEVEDCIFGKSIQALSKQIIEPRPTLSGLVLNINTAHFKIHYTLVGDDATTRAWAESTAVYAEYCWRNCDSLGWISPPPDFNNGGDNKYDIYIRNTLNHQIPHWGGCFGESTFNNPYPDGWTSWIAIYIVILSKNF